MATRESFLGNSFSLLEQTLSKCLEDKAPQLGALAHYTVFSLAPLVLVILAIGGVIFRNGYRDAFASDESARALWLSAAAQQKEEEQNRNRYTEKPQ
jgi:uncharacterized BrkB/YihY/UPF0761 family membrane protein